MNHQSNVEEGEFKSGDEVEVEYLHNNGLLMETKIVNFTGRDILVIYRDGVVGYLPANPEGPQLNCVLVGVKRSTTNGRFGTIKGDNDRLQNIRSQLAKDDRYIYYEESYHLLTLHKHKEGIYCRHTDLIIGLTNYKPWIRNHPFNPYISLNEAFNYIGRDYRLNIRAIDNSGMYKTIYTIINDSIVAIQTSTSVSEDDGVYITGAVKIKTVDDNDVRETSFVSLEDAFTENNKSNINFYKTLREAQEYLDNNNREVLKKEQERLIEEMKERKAQNEMNAELIKQQNAKATREYEDRLKRQTDEINLQQAQAKATYEYKSYEQKSNSDFYKLAGSFITMCLVLYKVF